MAGRYEIIKINPYKDSRGELKKIFKKSMLECGKEIGEIYVLYTSKDSVRGNHYHKSNTEFFTVLSGTATIALKDLEQDDAIILRIAAADDVVIKVPENVAHGFRNEEEADLIILAAATLEYDPEVTDTYVYRLL